jgi:acyl-CoA thioester hydrolase
MNRPRFPDVAEIRQLSRSLVMTVPPDWQDRNGHVNVQYYLKLYELGGYEMLDEVNLNEYYFGQDECGLFDFEHHINFRAEMHVGDQVSTYNRILAMHSRRFQGMYFIVNDTRDQLACTIEYVSACVNLQSRRTIAFPQILHDGLQRLAQKHQALDWAAPVCGAITI